jgi:hypothetical protein
VRQGSSKKESNKKESEKTVSWKTVREKKENGVMMSPIFRNSIAVVAGLLVGSVVNMALVTIGPMLVPPPPGVDMTDMDSLARSMDLFGPQHFLFPFLAHALGTLAGSTLAYFMAARNPRLLALGIGAFFLLGGISAARMIPAPTWFVAMDLALAYLPMAGLGIWLGNRLRERKKTDD